MRKSVNQGSPSNSPDGENGVVCAGPPILAQALSWPKHVGVIDVIREIEIVLSTAKNRAIGSDKNCNCGQNYFAQCYGRLTGFLQVDGSAKFRREHFVRRAIPTHCGWSGRAERWPSHGMPQKAIPTVPRQSTESG